MIDFEIIYEFKDLFLSGILNTLLIAIMSCCLGISIGSITGILLSLRQGILYWLIMLYVNIVRGTPMLIQVAAMFFMLKFAGYSISAFSSSIISIGLNSAAYMSQIVLAGIKSVHKGQWEAAKVLGFSRAQTMRYIIFPQAVRIVTPAFGNELITLVKDSSLASTIGVYELTKQGDIVMSQTFDVPTVYMVLACTYLIITGILSILVLQLDKKLAHHA
ncbi:amino acid ABC transporter permease [Candidatus Dependentiae bacterium]|nr:amino acid ABC transporter permease [Candidatus Dependentiae bacterium]